MASEPKSNEIQGENLSNGVKSNGHRGERRAQSRDSLITVRHLAAPREDIVDLSLLALSKLETRPAESLSDSVDSEFEASESLSYVPPDNRDDPDCPLSRLAEARTKLCCIHDSL